MDALELLTADHNRLRGLIARFETAKEADDVEALRELGQQVFAELTVHTAIEEEIFYPAVAGLSEEVKELVDEGVEEHHVVKVLMDEAAALQPDQPEWVAKLSVLIENVEHHAGEEEEEMFPLIRRAIDAEAREELGQRLDRAKGERGAPTLADTVDLTTTELRSLASEQEIPGRSSMNHDELAATVSPTT